MMVCPKCNVASVDGDKFCGECGALLSNVDQVSDLKTAMSVNNETLVCADCHRSIDYKVCKYCGGSAVGVEPIRSKSNSWSLDSLSKNALLKKRLIYVGIGGLVAFVAIAKVISGNSDNHVQTTESNTTSQRDPRCSDGDWLQNQTGIELVKDKMIDPSVYARFVVSIIAFSAHKIQNPDDPQTSSNPAALTKVLAGVHQEFIAEGYSDDYLGKIIKIEGDKLDTLGPNDYILSNRVAGEQLVGRIHETMRKLCGRP